MKRTSDPHGTPTVPSEALPIKSEGTRALSRRALLQSAAAVGAIPALPACGSDADGTTDEPGGLPVYEYDGPLGPENHFQHGVASGDPLADAVVLWTRVTQMGSEPMDVWWEIGTDTAFEKRVQVGTFTTDAGRDFTVKVDVVDLDPGTTYYYRFKSLGRTSPVGRTKTAPAGATTRARFAVLSCASLAHGYFHAYAAIAERHDLDAVLFLGDYIYEYPTGQYGDVREYEPSNEIVTLDDYRMRHAQYKRDPKLQEAHRQLPFICVWDDHEVANNSHVGGAENHTPDEGDYEARRSAAIQAYREWIPLREQSPGDKIFRAFAWGDLADVIMLDTRNWARDKGDYGLVGAPPPPDDMKELLGSDQWTWFTGEMTSSKAKWRIIGQQVMVGNLILNTTLWANPDQWHGYPKSRRQLLDLFRTTESGNIVVLTGDIHSSWAMDVVEDPNDTAAYDPDTGMGSVAAEFVTPAVTSPGIPAEFLSFIDGALPLNKHIKYFDLQQRGYMIVDVSEERCQAAWFHHADITIEADGATEFVAAWTCRDGQRHIVEDAEPAPDGAHVEPAP